MVEAGRCVDSFVTKQNIICLDWLLRARISPCSHRSEVETYDGSDNAFWSILIVAAWLLLGDNRFLLVLTKFNTSDSASSTLAAMQESARRLALLVDAAFAVELAAR